MEIGTSNRTAIRITPEINYGVTPNTPVFEPIRMTGESISVEFDNIVSNEIRNDRNRSDTVRVDQRVAGSIEFELSLGSFNTILEAVLGGTWSAPVANESTLKNGVINRSFTIQKYVADTTPDFYQNFVGCRFSTFDLNLSPGEFVTGSIGVMGKNGETSSTPITGQTLSAESTSEVLNSVGNITAITDNGVTSTEVYRSMSISINGNLRPLQALSNLGPVDINLGTMDITGNIELYFKDVTMYNRLVNNDSFAMSIQLEDSTGDYLTIKLPRMKLESGEITAGGLDQDLVVNATYRALYDSVSQCAIEIVKFDAP